MKEPLCLAIETSTPVGSVAVGTAASTLGEAVLGAQSRHSELLMPAIDFVLECARTRQRDLERVVVGGGPGSFTGLRIAAATAKGLAAALEIPIFAYSGLAALAAGAAAANRTVCAMFDARRGEVYAACYRFPDLAEMEVLLEPAPRQMNDVLAALDAAETLFVGEGALLHAAEIAERGGRVAPAHLAVPRASALIWLTAIAPGAGRIEHIAAWEPHYMRESGAERMRAK